MTTWMELESFMLSEISQAVIHKHKFFFEIFNSLDFQSQWLLGYGVNQSMSSSHLHLLFCKRETIGIQASYQMPSFNYTKSQIRPLLELTIENYILDVCNSNLIHIVFSLCLKGIEYNMLSGKTFPSGESREQRSPMRLKK